MSTRSMKVKVVALALFAATAATVALVPERHGGQATTPTRPATPARAAATPNDRPKVEVVFVLDTTGSMGGLIQAAKEKIWSIATTMARAQPAPELRVGLVAYRDRGDEYVTRTVDLSTDLDTLYATLMDFTAAGGGDGPESVNDALYDAVHGMSWSRDDDAYKVIFLVGDAPPHMDYQDDVKYPQTLAAARTRGIVVNAIQCGEYEGTAAEWQAIAQLAGGEYFRVDQTGSALAVTTPYDEKLAELASALDATRMYYGPEEVKAALGTKLAASKKLTEGSSIASRARRAEFNASEAGRRNLVGEHDLVDDVASGRVALADVEREHLPASLQVLEPEKQAEAVAQMASRREQLLREVEEVSRQRADYLRKQLEDSDAAADSLDMKLYETVRTQAKDKGLTYSAPAPAY